MKTKNQGISTILAFALLPLSGFATDIYLPSLPTMARDLQVGSIEVQLTLTLFLISYGGSQLFVGSFLDSFGRYKACLYSLVVFAMACVIVATTENIYVIYLMRIIHGITAGVIVVSKRAYFVDQYSGQKLKHYLSLFSIIWSTGPIVAPFIGGYLQSAFGWQSNFYLLAGMAIVLFILELIYSGETLVHAAEFHLEKIVKVYKQMLTTASFTLGLVMLGLAYCMVMIYNMTGPFIIENHLHLSPVVSGYSSLILGFAWMTGGFLSKATLNRPFYKKLTANIVLQAVLILAMLISLQWITNLYSLVFFAFIIHVGAGYTFSNYFTDCLSKFPKNAGIAGGLTGGVSYVIVSLLSYGIVNVIPAKDEQNLGYSYLILVLLSAMIIFAMYRIRNRKTEELIAEPA